MGYPAWVSHAACRNLPVPAFFIAGAIASFIKKEAILKYFSPETKKTTSYGIASVSGAILAVCSCTILPMFAGILKKGSGLGPAITFLYAGPAINVLAIVYTAKVLGFDLGIARAVAAIILSIVIGLIMMKLFPQQDVETTKTFGAARKAALACADTRPTWVIPVFFIFLIAILLIGTSALDVFLRLLIVYFLSMGVAFLLIYYFTRDEVTDWGYEIWDLTRKIFPILVIGTFALGVLAFFLPRNRSGPSSAPTRCWQTSLLRLSVRSSICRRSLKYRSLVRHLGISPVTWQRARRFPCSSPDQASACRACLCYTGLLEGRRRLLMQLWSSDFRPLPDSSSGIFSEVKKE